MEITITKKEVTGIGYKSFEKMYDSGIIPCRSIVEVGQEKYMAKRAGLGKLDEQGKFTGLVKYAFEVLTGKRWIVKLS